MSIFTRIRTLALSTLTAMIVVAPGCDDAADYEALGVTVEDLEAMSPEELDALDEELALTEKTEWTHNPHQRPEVMKELRNPLVWTHTELPLGPRGFKVPTHPTHGGEVPAGAALADGPQVNDPCDPFDPHGEDAVFAAK